MGSGLTTSALARSALTTSALAQSARSQLDNFFASYYEAHDLCYRTTPKVLTHTLQCSMLLIVIYFPATVVHQLGWLTPLLAALLAAMLFGLEAAARLMRKPLRTEGASVYATAQATNLAMAFIADLHEVSICARRQMGKRLEAVHA